MMRWVGLPLLLGTLAGAPAASALPQPFTVEHLPLLRTVATPRLSPDGAWVAYSVSHTDPKLDAHVSELKLIPTRLGAAVVVGEGQHPAWSPDSRRLAFERERDGRSAIWIYDLGSRESRELVALNSSDHFLGHEADKSFAWSPRGDHIAYFSTDPPEVGTTPTTAVLPRVVRRTQFKTRKGFTEGRATHLWVVGVEPEAVPRRLTSGEFDDHSLAWSPDGKSLVFVSNRSANPDENYSDDLFLVELANSRGVEVRRLTETAGTEMAPRFSPDGLSIAYLATRRSSNTKDSQVEDPHVFVLPSAGGEPRDLSTSLDRRPQDLVWHPDSKSLWLAFDERGRRPLGRLFLPTAEHPEPRFRREIEGFAVHSQPSLDATGRTLVYLRANHQQPGEVWISDVVRRGSRQLTAENQLLLRTVMLQGVDTLKTTRPDGSLVEGWLMKPPGWKATHRVPLVLWVHGGPHGMVGHGFSERLQLLAGRGLAVLIANPRGSTGYGQKFGDGTLDDWGGGDYQDLMAILDQTLSEYSWIDTTRLGVGGWSYGGYMTNWIVTQTDRFKAGVAGASLSNLVSFYGTSLYSDLIEVEFGGKPWEGDRYERLWQRSPLKHVAQVKTPLLLLHGESDHDVPVEQADEMYTALKRRGVETVMVRYPGEGHSIRRPSLTRDMFQQMLNWYGRLLTPVQPVLRVEDKGPGLPTPSAVPPAPAKPPKPPKRLFKEPEASAPPVLERNPNGAPLSRG